MRKDDFAVELSFDVMVYCVSGGFGRWYITWVSVLENSTFMYVLQRCNVPNLGRGTQLV